MNVLNSHQVFFFATDFTDSHRFYMLGICENLFNLWLILLLWDSSRVVIKISINRAQMFLDKIK